MDFTEVLKAKRELVWREIEKYLQKPLNLKGPFKISQKYQEEATLNFSTTVSTRNY